MGVPAARVIQGGTNDFFNALDIFENLVVPDAKHLEFLTFKPTGALLVLLGSVGMLPAIEFDDQTCREADEIDDIIAYGRLPAKLETINSLIAQPVPQTFFGFCQVGT